LSTTPPELPPDRGKSPARANLEPVYACGVSPPAKRVTIREVADAAGVSPAAVSYALRGIQVSEETQERVRRVADEMGYEANPIAFLAEQAGGRAVDGKQDILDVAPTDLHQRTPLLVGGREEIGLLMKMLQET